MSAPDPDRWQRVQELFEAALEVAPAQRRSFVARRCDGDAELALEVISLLAADDENPDYLENMAAGLADLVSDSVLQPSTGEAPAEESAAALADPLLGQQLDRYTIERKLARGGMGTVYLARRSDGVYDEQVAVKIIRRGMDSEQVVGRFRVERQILARLRHPNIANLLDGGITPDGRPYLVMEYVEGRAIDRYCREEAVGLEGRLRLMRTVCQAVQHAHNNLVVHRDLKPSNILVTGDGTVKLMDFGIAKLLAAETDSPLDEAPQTLPGLQVLTPGYAAPEQITGEDITTATDVFGLGIVLYQLLTGLRPFGARGATAQEIARATCETEPTRPSRASGAEGPAPVPSRRLSGDLDNICLMALRREPELRYPTPGQLADDLGRYLEGDPVAARPATLGYRAGKLVRRYRRAFAALAAALLVAVVLVSFYTARLAQERDRARRGEAKAEEVAAFLTDMVALASPDQSRGADITAREILARGAEQIEDGLADQPATRAAMLDVLGEVHASLGLYDESRELLGRALASKHALYGAEHPEVATTAASLAELESKAGRFATAESLYTVALAIHREDPGPRTEAVADDLRGLGLIASRLGEPEASEEHYRRALAIYESDPALQGVGYSVCLNDFALVLYEQGRDEEAEPMLREAIALQQRLLGDDHPELANTLYNLALLLYDRGDFRAAEPIQRRVLALDRQHYDATHPNLAYSLMTLGVTLEENGQFAEAEKMFAEAAEIRRAVLEPSHPDLIKTLGAVALARHRGGHYAEAEPMLREVAELAREHLGRQQITAGRIDQLGWNLHDQGRDAEALALHREALAIKLDTIGPDHKNTATSYMHLGSTLAGLGQLDAALEAQQHALDIALAQFGEDNLYTAATRGGMARIHLARGELDSARASAETALTTLRRQLDPDSPRIGTALQTLGRIHHARGEIGEAERCLRQALGIRRERLGAEHPQTAWSEVCLAEVLLDRGAREEAAGLARSALPVLEARLPSEHERVIAARRIAAETAR